MRMRREATKGKSEGKSLHSQITSAISGRIHRAMEFWIKKSTIVLLCERSEEWAQAQDRRGAGRAATGFPKGLRKVSKKSPQ